jgi:Zn-dependent protease
MDELTARLLHMVERVPVILFALTFHELAHAWLADKLGDPTARSQGRISLNPLRHLDPIGTIALFFFPFGWAKPVPVNPYFMRRQVRDFALTALAGPVANLILGVASGLVLRVLVAFNVSGFFFTLAALSVLLNFALALFNLIPIPPLDGSRVLYYLLPGRYGAEYIKLERFGIFIVLGLVMLDQRLPVLSIWMDPAIAVLSRLAAGRVFGF